MVNNYISTVHRDPLFVTLFFAALEPVTGELVYVNAGHEPPRLLRAAGGNLSLMPTGPLVGMLQGATYRAEVACLAPGDRLVLYTDGIVDARSSTGEEFGDGRWQQLLEGPVPAGRQTLAHLVEGIQAFVGDAAPFDDMTLLVVRRL